MTIRYDQLSGFDDPATASQKLTITRLCMALGKKTPIEETPMTIGEAGREIRALIGRLTIYERKGEVG